MTLQPVTSAGSQLPSGPSCCRWARSHGLSEGPNGRQYPTLSGGALSNQSNHRHERVQTQCSFCKARSLLTGPLESPCRHLPKMTILAAASLATASFWPAMSSPIKPTRGGVSCKTDGLIHIRRRPWASCRRQALWGSAHGAALLSVLSPVRPPGLPTPTLGTHLGRRLH